MNPQLFENAPKVEFGEVEVDATGETPVVPVGETSVVSTGETPVVPVRVALAVSVTVKDGDEAVKCAAEKVKGMFEATSDLGDWETRRVRDNAPCQCALPVEVKVEAGEGATMRFKVTPGDGTATRAFLRIRK